MLLEPTGEADDGAGFIDFVGEIDGSGGDFLKMPAGGSRLPASEKTCCVNGPPFASFCSHHPYAGASNALSTKTMKFIAPVALPLASSGFTSLMVEYGIMAAPDPKPSTSAST